MRKMTGVLIREWSQFVVKEVEARKQVEAQLAALVLEMDFLRSEVRVCLWVGVCVCVCVCACVSHRQTKLLSQLDQTVRMRVGTNPDSERVRECVWGWCRAVPHQPFPPLT